MENFSVPFLSFVLTFVPLPDPRTFSIEMLTLAGRLFARELHVRSVPTVLSVFHLFSPRPELQFVLSLFPIYLSDFSCGGGEKPLIFPLRSKREKGDKSHLWSPIKQTSRLANKLMPQELSPAERGDKREKDSLKRGAPKGGVELMLSDCSALCHVYTVYTNVFAIKLF